MGFQIIWGAGHLPLKFSCKIGWFRVFFHILWDKERKGNLGWVEENQLAWMVSYRWIQWWSGIGLAVPDCPCLLPDCLLLQFQAHQNALAQLDQRSRLHHSKTKDWVGRQLLVISNSPAKTSVYVSDRQGYGFTPRNLMSPIEGAASGLHCLFCWNTH